MQGHIFGQVVTLYQIYCTNTQNETTQQGGFCTALKIVRTVKKAPDDKNRQTSFFIMQQDCFT